MGCLISVKDFGAVGDGSYDDTGAVQTAASVLRPLWDTLYFPSGSYRLTQPISLYRNGSVAGAGPGLSWLIWESGNGIEFMAADEDVDIFQISNITLRTKAIGGTALMADFSAQIDPINGHSMDRTKTRFFLQNCIIQPDGPPESSGWDVGFDLIAGLIGQVRDCNFVGGLDASVPSGVRGTGCRFRGTGDQGLFNGRPVQFTMSGCTLMWTDTAVQFIGCEGGFLSQCNLVGVDRGIVWDSGLMQRPQLCVGNSHINSATYGIEATDLLDLQVNQVLFYNCTNLQSVGIQLTGGSGCVAPSITGNTFAGVDGPMIGIRVENGSKGVISNNLFRGNISTAIVFGQDASGFVGKANLLVDGGQAVLDNGSNNRVQVM